MRGVNLLAASSSFHGNIDRRSLLPLLLQYWYPSIASATTNTAQPRAIHSAAQYSTVEWMDDKV